MQRVERERQLEVADADDNADVRADADDITDPVAGADVIPDIAADPHTNADAVVDCQVENYSIRLQAAEREGKGLGDEVTPLRRCIDAGGSDG